MPQSVTSYSFQIAALAAATASMAVLDTPNVRLTNSLIVDNPENLLAAYTAVEADYTGYAATTPAWHVPYIWPDGFVRAGLDLADFVPSDAVTPNTIYNAFVNATSGMSLLASSTLPTPVALPDALHGLPLAPALPWATAAQLTPPGVNLSCPNYTLCAILNAYTAMSGILHGAKSAPVQHEISSHAHRHLRYLLCDRGDVHRLYCPKYHDVAGRYRQQRGTSGSGWCRAVRGLLLGVLSRTRSMACTSPTVPTRNCSSRTNWIPPLRCPGSIPDSMIPPPSRGELDTQ